MEARKRFFCNQTKLETKDTAIFYGKLDLSLYYKLKSLQVLTSLEGFFGELQ